MIKDPEEKGEHGILEVPIWSKDETPSSSDC